MRKPNQKIRKKRSFAFSFLYYWTKLVCINPLTLSDKNELCFSYYSLSYSIFLIVIYTYIWYCTLIERVKMYLPGETPVGIIGIVFMVGSEFMEAVSTWIMFGFYQNRVKLIVKSFIKAEKTSLKLDIQVDVAKSFRKLAIYLTVTTTTYVIVWMIINYHLLIVELHFNKFLWIAYVFPQIISFNVRLTFIWTLQIVGQKFRRLNDELRFVFSRSKKSLHCNSILADKIQLIAQLHRELRTVIYRTVQHIAVCVLFDIMAQFVDLTISTHIAYRFLQGCSKISFADFVYLVSVVLWIFIPIGLLSLISNASGSTTDEANKTGKMFHAMLNDIDNLCETQQAAKLNVLSLDLLKNQLRISVFGFFDLNYYLVFKIITTATTYLTIMLQFYN